jgi:hypothetical protein
VYNGCDAPRLLQDALALLARSRLQVLVGRLVHTLGTLSADVAAVSKPALPRCFSTTGL